MSRSTGAPASATPHPLWRRESTALLRIAAPAALTQLGLMLMGAVDTAMLGHYSPAAMAAGALGHNISMGVIIVAHGLLMAIDTLVAQAWGAGDRRRVRFHFQQGVMLALAVSAPIALLLWKVEPLLLIFGQPADVIPATDLYVRTVIVGVPAYLMFVALRQGLQSVGVVVPALIAIGLANLINLVANWALIFGHLGLPELGVEGSAWATSFSRWSMLALLLVLARRQLAPLRLWRHWRRPQRKEFNLFFRIGIPISIHTGVEFWMILGMALMMGVLGAIELAGHQVALTLAALAYMVSLGVSGAAAARVGQAVGAGDLPRARIAAAASIGLSLVWTSVSACIFLLAPERLSRVFTDDPAVIAVAVLLLPIAALFQLVDGLQVVSTGALRGVGDTRWPASIAILGYWALCLPLGYSLTFIFDFGVTGPWWGLAAGLGVTAVLLGWRLVRQLSRPVEELRVVPSVDPH